MSTLRSPVVLGERQGNIARIKNKKSYNKHVGHSWPITLTLATEQRTEQVPIF